MSDPQPLSYESPSTTLTGIGLGTIALQLLGVYCISLALPIFSMLASYLGASGVTSIGRPGWQILFSFMMPGTYLVIGALLIRYAPRLSSWLFRETANGVMAGPVTTAVGQHLQGIAFAVVGLMAIIDSVPRLTSFLWMAMTSWLGRFGSEGFGAAVEPIMRLLLGLALFLQSKGLALFWHKIRAGGVMPPRDSRETSP